VRVGNLGRPKTVTGEIMPRYLVAIQHADDYDPSVEDEAMGRAIDVLNEEMIAAGIEQVGQETSEGLWDGTWETYQHYEMPTGEGQ
jgi:hypothetical protein